VPVAAAAALALAATPAAADQVRHREWWLSAIHVTQAWESSRGSGVTVAVLDSGVDPAQRDLAGSVQAGPDFTGTGGTPGSPGWGVHGTGMAALIAGHGHGPRESDGTDGIAPAARILSIRVVPDRGDKALTDRSVAARLPDAVASGIRYAADHGAKVIDLPLDPGATDASGRGSAPAARGGSTTERDAVRYALGQGAVLVAPAGDDHQHGGAVNYPAGYPGVVAVGAIDQNFDPATFSSGRSYVSLTGPGVGVATARPGTSYTTVSSTAAASAVTAGVAALVRAEFPRLQPTQVTQALTQGTLFRHARRAGSGYGAVDAAGALRSAAAINAASVPAQPTSPAASPSTVPAQPAGFVGNVLRDLIAVAIAVVLIAAAFLLWRAGIRRRRARPRLGADPDSPLSGGLSGPPPTDDEALEGAALPGRGRRPRLAPVTGLPGTRDANPRGRSSDRPPWEDAPMPASAPPDWPAADPERGTTRPGPALEPPPGTGMPSDWSMSYQPGHTPPAGLDFHDSPGAAGLFASPNGLSGAAGSADGHHPGAADEPAGAEDQGAWQQPQASSPGPAVSPFDDPATDDPSWYEEDQQPFDDEDDRHL
jgi:hypothetical protein